MNPAFNQFVLLSVYGKFPEGTENVLHVQHMVSRRCKLFVEQSLKQLSIEFYEVQLGEIHLKGAISNDELTQLAGLLHDCGLEIMSDKNAIIIENIVNVIVEMVHYSKELPKQKFSLYLSEKLGYEYSKLALLFSKAKGITIEQYIILHKIERIKELIMYDELTLSEIADRMHYSNIAHLSQQFKKVTGLTPSFYKALPQRNRKNIEDL